MDEHRQRINVAVSCSRIDDRVYRPTQRNSFGPKPRDEAARGNFQAVAKEKTRHAAERVESSVPEPVTERGRQAAEVARRNPIPVAAAAISATALIWLLARRRRRS